MNFLKTSGMLFSEGGMPEPVSMQARIYRRCRDCSSGIMTGNPKAGVLSPAEIARDRFEVAAFEKGSYHPIGRMTCSLTQLMGKPEPKDGTLTNGIFDTCLSFSLEKQAADADSKKIYKKPILSALIIQEIEVAESAKRKHLASSMLDWVQHLVTPDISLALVLPHYRGELQGLSTANTNMYVANSFFRYNGFVHSDNPNVDLGGVIVPLPLYVK